MLRRRQMMLEKLIRQYATAASSVVLRPYQEHCLEACIDALKTGVSRIGVSLPTGAGKTTVFVSLLSRISPPANNPHAKRALIIVNSIELARQAASQTARICPHWSVEIEQGTRHKASGNADVTVATYQTLLQPQRLAKFDPKRLKAVVIDEAHHAAAPSYRSILSNFDHNIQHPDTSVNPPKLSHTVPILGFSATFSRHDGLALGSVFERIVYHRDFLEMIKEQWLCNVRFTTVQAKLDLSEVTINSRTGDFNPTRLAQVINTDTVNNLVIQSWLDRAATRKSTLVFCVNLAHVSDLTAAFRTAGVDARYVYSGTPIAERKALITDFKEGRYPVLINCAVLTEGADIPNIDCVVVARPTRSKNLFAQMIGRGMRLSPDTGKEDCHIIDFVDSMGSVDGVVSTPSLFGIDPNEVIEDETLEDIEERVNAAVDSEGLDSRPASTNHIPDPKSVTYVDYENPFTLVGDASGAPHITKLSKNAWVGCGGDVYVLECLGSGFIRVEPIKADEKLDGHYKSIYTPATLPPKTSFILKISPYQRSRLIGTANTLGEAVRGCDLFATSKVVKGGMAAGLLRSAKWRRQLATESQMLFVKKRWAKRKTEVLSAEPPEDGQKSQIDQQLSNMTKGEAANIIIRLKHGAQSRYEKKAKANKKAYDMQTKEITRRAREEVKVGPLPQAVRMP